MDAKQLADRLEKLSADRKASKPWRVDLEPHDYADGTKHFNHVRYQTSMGNGADITVEVAQYVTPALGELLCLLNNNLDVIIGGLRSVGEDRVGMYRADYSPVTADELVDDKELAELYANSTPKA